MSTILIADDEQPMRQFIARAMADSGHQTLLAMNGRQALELMEKERPDLVISDVMMPLMGGVELCQHLKGAADTAAIPVILMTAGGERIVADAGYDGFLAKPFDLDVMEALVERCLDRRMEH
ncbi:MAG TPA: response regulator [Chloroflexota bacterium]|nr:response regulator [Chloroflexota bacterium]